jgi:uncharacterized protein (TIGR02271 family)
VQNTPYGNEDVGRSGAGRDLPLVDGTPVYDASGDKVGDVSQHQAGQGYFVMTKGFFFPKDLYVPMSAIQRATTDGVFLNLSKDQINDQHWDQRPREDRTAARRTTAREGITDRGIRAQQGPIDVPLVEEELEVHKERVARPEGEVRLHKDVVEEQQSVEVPVTHEEVHVERAPVSGEAAGQVPSNAFQERDIEVPVMEETVDVEKRARVGEEVRIEKTPVTEQKRFTETVRKEKLSVDQAGGRDLTRDEEDLARRENEPPAPPMSPTP